MDIEFSIPLTKTEAAIMKIVKNKTSEDERLGSEFYKCFKEQLS